MEFYPTLDQSIVEDYFRQAITKYGVPEAVYFSNGRQYRTKRRAGYAQKAWHNLSPNHLPEQPQGGPCNRVVDSFLA